MEEIVLVFSSLAGACTAVALDKIPLRRNKMKNITVNSVLENQLHSLQIEKEIVGKTIARLHQEGTAISKVQRDKLLIRYQHQLGIIMAKIEKLENSRKYPDLGPVGDSLITLMDKRLSLLDERLHEISSKITISKSQQVVKPESVEQKEIKLPEQPQKIIQEKKLVIDKIEVQTEPRIETKEKQNEKIQEVPAQIYVPTTDRRRSVELSTLTEITNKIPEFPVELIKPSRNRIDSREIIEESSKESLGLNQPQVTIPDISYPNKEETVADVKPETSESEKKIQLPRPIKIPEEEKIEDDDKDLDKIKNDIMKALSKLEQVEVE